MHYLSVCAIFKNELIERLLEWIEYHRLIGVDHFYLLNNDDCKNPCLHYYDKDVMTETIFPNFDTPQEGWGFPQIVAYNWTLTRAQTKWLAFIDIDEFLYPVSADTLPEVLKDYEQYGGLAVNTLYYGSSGHINTPEWQLDSFVHHAPRGWCNFVKSIVQPERTWLCDNPHHFFYKDGWCAVDEQHRFVTWKKNMLAPMDRIRVNHYILRSWKEFQCKLFTGRGDRTTREDNYWEIFDRNDVLDTGPADRFLDKVKERVLELKPRVKKLARSSRLVL